jgi:hypothetical protein
VLFEEKLAAEGCDTARGYPSCDYFVRFVLQWHGHVGECLEVFQPYISDLNSIKRIILMIEKFNLHHKKKSKEKNEK